MRPPRVFGIGLSRTGSRSLMEAMRLLGYRARHWDYTRKLLVYDEEGVLRPRLELLEPYDAYGDVPISLLYKVIDREYPGSKYVLTVREQESWLRSCRRFFAPERLQGLRERMPPAEQRWRDLQFNDVWGTLGYDEAQFLAVRARHEADVREYFRERPGDLLVLDISAGQGWAELCPFLDRAVPDVPFPSVTERGAPGPGPQPPQSTGAASGR